MIGLDALGAEQERQAAGQQWFRQAKHAAHELCGDDE
jgi:hypothetical protein